LNIAIYGPEPIRLEGRPGDRYWINAPYEFTGVPAVDERLSGYPVAVFRPPGRPAPETPVVVGLNGMAAPYQWLGFIVPTLLDLGIACVLFETPFAGERSLVRGYSGDILRELEGFLEHRVPITAAVVLRLVQGVAEDFGTVLRLVEDRYGLTDTRRALFGVSLGTLLSAFAFLRDGIGDRLLGTIGHADLRRFALSYTPPSHRLLSNIPAGILSRFAGPKVTAGLAFLRVLNELATGRGHAHAINPMTYLDRIGEGRRVRFLVGQDDPVVKPADAVECARRFPDGECIVVPGLGHGDDRFAEHVRDFLIVQLGDWSR
jgi:pimeloyl-ACP methyl ester carboxylesterase